MRRNHKGLFRGNRAMSMLMTVLLIVAASSISAALIRQSQVKTEETGVRTSISAIKQATEVLLTEAEVLLQNAPDSLLFTVGSNEAERICLSGPRAGDLFGPGSSWPEECGTAWGYLPVSGDWVGERLEYRLPSSSTEELAVTARARFESGIAHVSTSFYLRDTTGKISLAVVDEGVVDSSAAVNGVLYAYAVDTTGYTSPSTILAESVLGTPRVERTLAGSSVRELLDTIPTSSSVAGAAEQVKQVACGATPLYTDQGSNTLCFIQGDSVFNAAGNSTTVPTVAAYELTVAGDELTVGTFSSFGPGVSSTASSWGNFNIPLNAAVWFDAPVVVTEVSSPESIFSLGAPGIYFTGDVSGVNGYHSSEAIGFLSSGSSDLSLSGLFSAADGLVSDRGAGTAQLSFTGTVVVGSQTTHTCGVSPAELCGFASVTFNQGDFFSGSFWGTPLGGGYFRVNSETASDQAVGADWFRYTGSFAHWSGIEGLENRGRNSEAVLDEFSSGGLAILGDTGTEENPATPSIEGLPNTEKTFIVACLSGQVFTVAATVDCNNGEPFSFTSTAESLSFSEGILLLEAVIFPIVLTEAETAEVLSEVDNTWSSLKSTL